MKVTWEKNRFLILFALIFSICIVNNTAIILLGLNLFQIVITTTICIAVGIALIFVLGKHGCFTNKTKDEGNSS